MPETPAQAEQRESSAEPPHPVVEKGVRRAACHQRDPSDERGLRPLSGALDNPAHRVDDGADAGMGGAHKRPTVLDGPEDGQRQMLGGLDGIAEPGVVRQVDDGPRTAVLLSSHNPPHGLRQDVLVKDVHCDVATV